MLSSLGVGQFMVCLCFSYLLPAELPCASRFVDSGLNNGVIKWIVDYEMWVTVNRDCHAWSVPGLLLKRKEKVRGKYRQQFVSYLDQKSGVSALRDSRPRWPFSVITAT